jgi:hypothetical protein
MMERFLERAHKALSSFGWYANDGSGRGTMPYLSSIVVLVGGAFTTFGSFGLFVVRFLLVFIE